MKLRQRCPNASICEKKPTRIRCTHQSMMKGMIVCLTVLVSGFITSTSALPVKGTGVVIPQQEKGKTEVEESLPGREKETPDGADKRVAFLCRSACADIASSATKGNSSRCQILLRKLSRNHRAYKQVLNYCSRCSCNRKIKELSKESKTETDLQTANSFTSLAFTLEQRNSNTETRNNQYIFPKENSETLKYSQKYNPRSKSSDSGFVPVPGPYGFRSSTTKYPRQSQYRSDSYEDDITDRDYYDTTYDDEDLLGNGNFEILKGGVFPYNDNNRLGHGHREDYTGSYSYATKNSKVTDRRFNNRFPFSFPDILSTERRSEITQATNSKGVLSHLFASTSDLDSTD